MLVRNTWIQSQDEKGIVYHPQHAVVNGCFLDMSALRGSFTHESSEGLLPEQEQQEPPKIINSPKRFGTLQGPEPSRSAEKTSSLLFTLLSPYVPITTPIHPPPFLPYYTPLPPPPPICTLALEHGNIRIFVRIRQWVECCRYESISWDSET